MDNEMDFWSITPLGCFNAPDEFSESGIILPYCSFIKLTPEQINDWFERKQGDSGNHTMSTGTLIPTMFEKEKFLRDKYFLCFNAKELHDKHFTFVGYALRLLYKFPAIATRTFSEDYAQGSLAKCYPHQPLHQWEDIPDIDAPANLRTALQEYKRFKRGEITFEQLPEETLELREWRNSQYMRFYWRNSTEDGFLKLEKQIRTLFDDERDNQNFSYLRFAINWYVIAQDSKYPDHKIAFSCLILELLCLKPNGSRGKGNQLARGIDILLPGPEDVKSKAKKLIKKKYYKARSQIMHGFAYDDQTLNIEEWEIELMFDVCRRIILFMLEKCVTEQKGKDRTLRDVGIIK